jgi:hypothetical protein
MQPIVTIDRQLHGIYKNVTVTSIVISKLNVISHICAISVDKNIDCINKIKENSHWSSFDQFTSFNIDMYTDGRQCSSVVV